MLRRIIPALFALATLAGCGGGGGGSAAGPAADAPATVGIALTDDPSPDFDRALATITSVDLLGEGQVNLFSGEETVDLLRLADYSELFAVRDDVPPGTYTKVRLQLSRLELIRLDDAGEVEETVVPKLVANGKLDLNPQGPFRVAPGATLVITIDFDVNKSLKITTTGNGKTILRPVVFVDIATDLPAPGLTRIHGVVSDLSDDGSFRLCQTRLASALPGARDDGRFGDEHCVRVQSDTDTGVFGEDGLPQEFFDLADGEEVTAIGRLRPVPRTDYDDDDDDDDDGDDDGRDECFVLTAYVIEEGPPGAFSRLRGTAVGPVDPGTDRFPIELAPGQGILADEPLAVQLYPRSRIFAASGVELGRLDIGAGDPALVDSVLALGAGGDVLRTALVVLDAGPPGGEVLLRGELLTVDNDTGQLLVATPAGDRCVDAGGADVFLVSEDDGSLQSERGTLDDLAAGQDVNVFGREGPGGCLVAETILAES